MSNLKKVIVILSIIIILIGIVLVIFWMQGENTENEAELLDESESASDESDEDINKMKIVDVRNEFFLVQDCVRVFYNNYLSFCNSESNYEKVYNILDAEYIEMFNITEDNLNGRFGTYQEIDIDITNMYVMPLENNKNVYFVYGYLMDNTTSNLANLAIEIKIDNSNNTFSVLPYEYLEAKGYLNITETSTPELEVGEIENKTYNVCQNSYRDEETYVTQLFETYINRNLYNIEFAYRNLDSEYAQKKFENIQNYEEFIREKEELYLSYDMKNAKKVEDFDDIQEYTLYLATFQALKLDSYKKTTQEDYTQYVCIDNLGNYYIFRETAPMQYTVILDTYTIDLPEFIEEYEKASDEDKVLMNIQRFFDAIEDEDYRYAYNKLDETFKTNNFATLEEFENYAKANFFEQNDLSAGRAEKQGDIYLYNVTISNASEESNQTITTSFVMQLKEGTDFVMSFSI